SRIHRGREYVLTGAPTRSVGAQPTIAFAITKAGPVNSYRVVRVSVCMPPNDAIQDADLRLMQRVASNDQVAVSDLYDRFGSLVYRLAVQAMPTRADAEDAVQEIFVRLWRTAGRYDPKRAALVTWVMLISRRHLVDRLRRAKARLKPSALDERQTLP